MYEHIIWDFIKSKGNSEKKTRLKEKQKKEKKKKKEVKEAAYSEFETTFMCSTSRIQDRLKFCM